MEIPTEFLPLVAVALYAVVMFLYRKWTAGESFDLNKILQALGLGALATAALYVANGVVPEVNTVIEYMTQYAGGNEAGLAAIGAAMWGLFDQYILRGKATGTALITSVSSTTPVTITTPTVGSPSFAAGLATILGIYGGSASGNTPAPSFTCDVNQVPQMFYDLLTVSTGKVMLSVAIDGTPLKDCEEDGIDLQDIGTKTPRPFWIPQKFRTVGSHVLTIKMGHLEGPQALAGAGDSKPVWDSSASFALTFTGTKASE